MFWYNITYMVNSFTASLDSPAVINISYEMIQIQHQKMLNEYICIDYITIHQRKIIH